MFRDSFLKVYGSEVELLYRILLTLSQFLDIVLKIARCPYLQCMKLPYPSQCLVFSGFLINLPSYHNWFAFPCVPAEHLDYSWFEYKMGTRKKL